MKKIFLIFFIFTSQALATQNKKEFDCLLASLNGEVRGQTYPEKIAHLSFFVGSAKKYGRTFCEEWNFKNKGVNRWSSNNIKVKNKILKEKSEVPDIFFINEIIVKDFLNNPPKDYQNLFISKMSFAYSIYDMMKANSYIRNHLGVYEIVANTIYFKTTYNKTENYKLIMKELKK